MHKAPILNDDPCQDSLDKNMREWEAAAWRVLHRLTVQPAYWNLTMREKPELIAFLAPRHFPPGDFAIIAQAIDDTLRNDAAATFETIGKAAIEAGADPKTLLSLVSLPEAQEFRHQTLKGYVRDANRLTSAAARSSMASFWIYQFIQEQEAKKGQSEA